MNRLHQNSDVTQLKPKIFPLISLFSPTLLMGGSERVLVELANGLVKLGWRVDVILMSKVGPLIQRLRPEVNLVDLQSFSYRRGILALVKYFDTHRPALILTSLYATGLAVIVARFFSKHKPIVIVGAHSSLLKEVEFSSNIKDKIFLKPLCKVLFPRADGIVAVSLGVAEQLRSILSLGPTKIITIYNPVISSNFPQSLSDSISRSLFESRQMCECRTIVSVGRLVPEKRFDLLLDALCSVRQYHDCRLTIVGDGPMKGELVLKAKTLQLERYVNFVGWQDDPYSFLMRSEVFVLASRAEGFANVIVEALACGCQVVSTRCDFGPEEVLEGGKYGELANVDDVDDIADKIVKLLENPRAKEERALRVAHALKFNVDACVNKYSGYFLNKLGVYDDSSQ